ncbi:staphopain peptidase C47 [Enterococcus faecalis TX4248]|uniref:Staphopain peptidase C47 n=1 Tax=Enterococcus faecalis TX4248 TaxID=749495 RepID=A0A125W6K8_ENTFL|nr:C47 family peptidase [Enterococcus faecalis]EFM82923.1 staphopain peptidase C47 [Enterococcus faecalis TX4248]
MKKFILSVGLFITSLLFGINTFAIDGDKSSLYIQTNEVPSELTIQAQKDWKFYFENLSVIENTEPLSAENFYLGQPFTLNDETNAQTAYFPIIDRNSGTIHDLLETSLINNTPTLTISSQFVDQLNSLTPTTEGSSFSVSLDSENHQLLSLEEPNREQVVDVKQEVDNLNRTKRSVPDDTVPEYNRNIIPNWMITETQGSEPWCMFYTLSTMINSVEGKAVTNAKTFAKKTFPNASEKELIDGKYITSKPFAHPIQTMQKEYGYTLDIKNSRLTPSEVQTQIDKKAPVYVALDNVTQNFDPARSHGITVMGYIIAKNNTLDSYYYFWNPWWQKVMLTNQKDMSNWKLNDNVYSWKYSGINFRKEPVKVAENPMTMTEVSKTVMVNTQPKSIDSLPWGRQGYVKIDNSTNHTGKVVTLTQDAGSYAYSPDLKGWIDKKGVTEVIATNISTKVEKAGFSIDPIPWQSGVQHTGYTKDHINQAVTITARQGSYYYVPSLGWIDKKAFNAKTQSQVDAVKSSNTVTNTKWTVKNTENHLTVLNNGKSIDTLPWGKKGFKNLGNVNTYANQYIHITQDAGSYVYSPELKGWVDKKGLSSN